MRELFVTSQFRKDLKIIPAGIKEQVDTLLPLLRNNPTDFKLLIKKLKGFSPPIYRIRIGAYRLVYAFNAVQVILLRIRHRKDVYKNLSASAEHHGFSRG